MRRVGLIVAMLTAVAACAGSEGETQSAADTLTRGQKDTIISNLPIPGAGGVGRALDAAERLNARTEAHDTIG